MKYVLFCSIGNFMITVFQLSEHWKIRCMGQSQADAIGLGCCFFCKLLC